MLDSERGTSRDFWPNMVETSSVEPIWAACCSPSIRWLAVGEAGVRDSLLAAGSPGQRRSERREELALIAPAAGRRVWSHEHYLPGCLERTGLVSF